MSEIINWILWSVGVCVVAGALVVAICRTFIVIAETVTESKRQKVYIADRVAECHRWFSGFKDLDVIWDYIFANRTET